MTTWNLRLIRDTYYPFQVTLPEDLALPMRVEARRVPSAAFFNICPIWQAAPFAPGVREMILARPWKAWWVRPLVTNRTDAILLRFDNLRLSGVPNSIPEEGVLVSEPPDGELMRANDRSLIIWADWILPLDTASVQRMQQIFANRFLFDQMTARGLPFQASDRPRPEANQRAASVAGNPALGG